MRNKQYIYDLTLLSMLAFVLLCRARRGMADWYAARIYPAISGVLSRVSSLLPFSLDEILVVFFLSAMILMLIHGIKKRTRWYSVLLKEARCIMLIYVWFYIGWGLNYSRSSLSQRLETPVARYDEDDFKAFLSAYASQLDSAFIHRNDADVAVDVKADIRSFYASLPSEAGLCIPRRWQEPKWALASRLFSKVGVTGSMGPFLSESMLNSEMPETWYPFTAAHEFAHLMGVSSEAEANFWAFRYCLDSADASIRYSGCLSLLGNVLRNARRLLAEEEYKEFVSSIRIEVREDYNASMDYWSGKYSRLLGSIQNTLYNTYLKGNGISSGTSNYDEVVSLLMTDFPL